MVIMAILSISCLSSFLTIFYHFQWCFDMFRPVILRFPWVFLLFLLNVSSVSYFRFCYKFDSNDSFFNRGESERDFTGMQNNIFNERDNSFATNTIIRSSIIHHANSPSSVDSFSLPTA